MEPVLREMAGVSEHRRYAVHHRDQALEVEPSWKQVLPTAGVNTASAKARRNSRIMSSRFLLPGEADYNPICNMWARDTPATGCSVVTGSPVDAPRVYQRGYAAENRVHWLYEVPISIDEECGACPFLGRHNAAQRFRHRHRNRWPRCST